MYSFARATVTRLSETVFQGCKVIFLKPLLGFGSRRLASLQDASKQADVDELLLTLLGSSWKKLSEVGWCGTRVQKFLLLLVALMIGE